MFPPIDWMVHVEQRRLELSRSGQRRFALLAMLAQKDAKQTKKTEEKPAAQTATAPVQCRETSAA